MRRTLAVAVGLLVVAVAAFAAQSANVEDEIELLRKDIRGEKAEIISQGMDFTEEESTAFWPIYREYEREMTEVGDETVALIKDYAANYDTLTDMQAEELVKRHFKIKKKGISVQEKYYKKLAKAVGAKKAARWAQLENRMNMLMQIQVAAGLPLAE